MAVKWNRKSKTLTIFFVCVIVAISISFFFKLHYVNKEYGKYFEFESAAFSAYGYSVEDDVYTNVIADAQIQLPEINTYINNVTVMFSEPLLQPINITVYYAGEDHGYGEDHKASANIAAGSEKAVVLVDADVTTCRVDITMNIGEVFSLEKIVLNDDYRLTKNFEIFTTTLWFAALYIATVFLFLFFMLKKWNRKYKILVVLSICMALIISDLFLIRLQDINKVYGECKRCDAIEMNTFSTYGYSVENNVYTNEIGDAQIQLPEINAYVNNVAVMFSEPLPQPINIEVYYAEEDHGYNEDYKASTNIAAGSKNAVIFVRADVITCRIDITTNIGEVFSLEKIVINDNDTSSKDVDVFTTALWFAALYIATVLLFTFLLCSIRIEQKFAIAALVIGFIYLLIITPLSPPDEAHHYHSSYQLSNYFLLHWKDAEQGNSAHFNYTNLRIHDNVKSGYQRIIEEIGLKAAEGTQIEIPIPRSLSYFVQYIPQGIGISLARLFNLNFIWLFIIGRVFNLLFFSLCLYFAVKRTPRYKLLLGLIGIMPMALHQAASYSYDGFINGMSLVLIASLLKAIYEDEPLSNKDYLWILISGMLLAPAKTVYTVILLLAFLIPKQRFNGKKDQIVKISALFILCAIAIAAFQMRSLINVSGLNSSSGLNWEGQHNYTISYIFAHPLSTAEMFWNSFVSNWELWFIGSIGHRLSGLLLVIRESILWQFCGLLLMSVFEHEDSKLITSGKERAVFLAVVGINVILVMLSMFLAWTSDTRQIIQGVQGRYFIPVLPLLFMSCGNRTIVLRKPIDKFCICAAILLHARVIYRILAYTCGW